jgi:hypothetical protein
LEHAKYTHAYGKCQAPSYDQSSHWQQIAKFRPETLAGSLLVLRNFYRSIERPVGGIAPTMVAPVMNGANRAQLPIHCTYLARIRIREAPLDPRKMMLGPFGYAVRLAEPDDTLIVGEVVEACLATMWATRPPHA